MTRAESKLKPISFLPSLRGNINSALKSQTHHVALIKKGMAHKGAVYEMRKASVEYLELSNEYQLQINAWKHSTVAFSYKNDILALEEDLSKLRSLSKFILHESACLL